MLLRQKTRPGLGMLVFSPHMEYDSFTSPMRSQMRPRTAHGSACSRWRLQRVARAASAHYSVCAQCMHPVQPLLGVSTRYLRSYAHTKRLAPTGAKNKKAEASDEAHDALPPEVRAVCPRHPCTHHTSVSRQSPPRSRMH